MLLPARAVVLPLVCRGMWARSGAGAGARARPRAVPLLVHVRNKAGKRCDAHMNELPIPCGPWDPWYASQQSYYLKWLVLGVLTFVASVAAMITTGSFNLMFAPAEPSPPTRMTELCE